jgi:hypothetical protein
MDELPNRLSRAQEFCGQFRYQRKKTLNFFLLASLLEDMTVQQFESTDM